MREAIVGPDASLPQRCGHQRGDADQFRLGSTRLQHLLDNLRGQGLVAVAHYSGHATQGGQFLWSALRIAAGDDDPRRGIVAVGAPDERAGAAIGLCRHAAGVDNDYVRSRRLLHAMAGGAQALGDRFAVGAGRPAAKVFDVESNAHLP